MKFIETDNTELINNYRTQLYKTLNAPVDAMWELLYIASSKPYLIENDTTLGYCCISEGGSLTQIYLTQGHQSQMEEVIKALVDQELIQSANLSSKEPVAFNFCLHHSKSIKANTYCFEHPNQEVEVDSGLNIQLVTPEDIPQVKLFLKEQVGMDDTFGYTENLVSRKEIFMLKDDDTIVATSERRLSDTQPEIADLGIIVNRKYHGRGLATSIMQMQVNNVLNMGRKPICSTTVDNAASRKVIENAGFYCTNIIFDIMF